MLRITYLYNLHLPTQFMQRNALFIIIILLTTLQFGCSDESRVLKLVKVIEVGGTKMADKPIVEMLSQKKKISVELSFSDSQDSVIQLLDDNKIDMAILPNSILSQHHNISTITSLLPRILLIVHKPELDSANSLKELVTGRNVGYQNFTEQDVQFVSQFFNHYGVDISKDFTGIKVGDTLTEMDNLDVYVTLTHIQNPIIYKLIKDGNRIYTLDNPALRGSGSSVDGFVLTSPNAYPFILPKGVYSAGPADPILTIGVRDILVGHNSLDPTLVYNIIQTISENKTALTQMNKSYGLLNLDYNSINTSFAFPLHPGSIDYLDRNQPTFFERYAELSGVIISLIVILVGTLAQVRRYLKQRKKDRIDDFYKSLLVLRRNYVQDEISKEDARTKINQIRKEAFEALIHEKLDANESFGIFLQLYNDIAEELHQG